MLLAADWEQPDQGPRLPGWQGTSSPGTASRGRLRRGGSPQSLPPGESRAAVAIRTTKSPCTTAPHQPCGHDARDP